ncbi:MAG TPA: tRNA epoxyqueuosine(34) reductase QueG [Opitutaceae bacterium]
MPARQEELRRALGALGFDAVRFAAIADTPGAAALQAWLAAGRQADMAWMERSADKRCDPALVLPGAKSMVLLGVNYWPGEHFGRAETEVTGKPIWARYVLNEDYHDTIKPALIAAGREIERLFGVAETDYRYYVDTGPVLERGWAARAGLGFIGKNAMLISREFGNWLFLAAILTRIEFVPDVPLPGDPAKKVGQLCGKCTRCLEACPTGAIVQPGVVDARLCISYQTIENKGVIPRELRPAIGTHIYGCDVCLEVCPWNRFAQAGRPLLLVERSGLATLTLREILELTPERFADVFRRTAVKRLKLTGLLRNACVVAGNTVARDCLDVLVRLAGHTSPVVRAHAVWAVQRLGEEASLAAARAAEADPSVLSEYADQAGDVQDL